MLASHVTKENETAVDGPKDIMKHRTRNSLDMLQRRDSLTRRRFFTRVGRVGLGAFGLAWALPGRPRPAFAEQPAPASAPIKLLEESPYVYISPLLRNGEESSCHAELWYGWIDDSVIVTVAKERWKATALTRGLEGARIWVGNHGRWKTMLGGRNEDFRTAPNFIAKAERVDDPEMIERLLVVYAKKYPNEIDTWREKMRSGSADGSRVLLRYRPIPGDEK
jgi:hypothetical protein